MLRNKWEQLSNIFHGGKKNFFTIYQRDYTWIPVSILP
jgi:hypothetical protein